VGYGCGCLGVGRAGKLCLKKKRRGVVALTAFPFLSTQGRTMPSRGPRPSLVRTHSRSSSGGSSKVVYNLQLTQKDPVVQSKIDKARRTSHTLEVRHRFPNINSTALSELCSQNFVHVTQHCSTFLFSDHFRLLTNDMDSQIHG
jgi:hypothetical protein